MDDDGFTKRKCEWLEQVFGDLEMGDATCRVAFAIGVHWNRELGHAWPGQACLAAETGLSVRGVQKCLALLAKRKHIRIVSGKGRRHSSDYWPIENTNLSSSFQERKMNGGSSFLGPENTNGRTRKHEPRGKKTRTGVRTEQSEEHSEEQSERDAREKPKRNGKALPMPEIWPSKADLDWAVSHWHEHGRDDLSPRVEQIAAKAKNHHVAKGTHSKDWIATWRSWALREIEFTKTEARGVTFEQTSIAGWRGRLEVYYRGAEDVPVGSWSSKWGPKPGESGCRAPKEAFEPERRVGTGR